jgi:hypothetical protein
VVGAAVPFSLLLTFVVTRIAGINAT